MKPFVTGHEDLIHDVSYDYYGGRIATCSSDQHIKVFDYNEQKQDWELNDSWKAHDANITKVVWANPQFGQVVASCSYDRSIRLFEENEYEPKGKGRRWRRLAILSDSRGPIHDVWFAPAHLGLRIAAIGTDAYLRIYEALEPSDLHYWSLTTEIPTLPSPPARELECAFCLTWCPYKFAPEQLAVCSMNQAFIYRKDGARFTRAEQLPDHGGLIRDVSWAPAMGRSFQLVATACQDGYVRIFKLTPSEQTSASATAAPSQQPVASSGSSAMLATSAGSSNADSGNESLSTAAAATAAAPSGVSYTVETVGQFDDHKGEVWRTSWNATGRILSSAGDDGKIRLWKAVFSGEFQCMAVMTATQAHDTYGDDEY